MVPDDYRSPLFVNSFGTPARLIAAILLSLVILDFLSIRNRPRRDICVNPGIVIFALYLGVMFLVWGLGLRVVGTANQEFSKASAISSYPLVFGLGTYAVIRLGSSRNRAIVLGSLLIGIAYSALVGVVQHVAQVDFADLLKPAGFEAASELGAGDRLPERGNLVRAFGTVGNYLVLGALSASAVPLAIHFARYSSSRARRFSAAIATLVLLASIPMTLSRSALISCAVSLGFYLAFSRIRLVISAAAAVSAVAAVMVLTYPQTLRVLADTIENSAEDGSILARIGQIETMRKIIVEHPVSGLGLGAIPVSDFGPIDNYVLVALAEGGIVWAIGFATVVIGAVIAIALAIRFSANTEERDQNLAVGAFFIGLLVASGNFATLNYDPIFFTFFLLIGILWAACPSFSLSEGWVTSTGAGFPSGGQWISPTSSDVVDSV